MSAAGPGASSVDRRWSVLVVVAVAQLMVVLDGTIVNIALPSAQQALGFSNSDRQWVVTAYALAFGSLLLVGGRLGDMFSRKRVFITGLVGFAVASAIGGAAGSFAVLVTARALHIVERRKIADALADSDGNRTRAAEVLDENRFLAARDGMGARLIDLHTGHRVPAADLLDRLLAELRPHAEALGCERELAGDDGDDVINHCSVVVVADSRTTTPGGTSSINQTATATTHDCTVVVVPDRRTTSTPPPVNGGDAVVIS